MSIFSKNYKPTPVDSLSKRVASESSIDDRFEIADRDKKLDVEFWEAPRLHKKIPVNNNFTNLTGTTIGKLTVIGWLGKGSWQCRCVCGRYCARKTKFVTDISEGGVSTNVMCSECYALLLIKKREYFKKYGKYPEDAEKIKL